MKTAEIGTRSAWENVSTWLAHGRFDSWENPVTGFGTLRDKTIYSLFQPSAILGDITLEQLYHNDDLAARMIDTVPEEMLRKGYSLDIEDSQDLADDAIQALTELDANSKIIEAEIWAKTFGGAVLIPVADDGFPAFKPLRPERVKKIDSLEVIDRRFVWPHSFYQSGPKRDQVEVYAVGSVGPTIRPEFLIHETRLIVFRGARTSRVERMRRGYWDVSALQRPYEVMRAFATGFKSVELLLSDGPQGVYGIKDLHRLIAGNNQAAITARLEAVDQMRSALRAIAIDKEYESFERSTFSFSGIPDVLDKLMLRLAASVRMPVTILMGQSPAGMNATGESDFRWFYDRVATEQQNYLAPRLRELIKLLLATKEGPSSGKVPEKFSIDFEALWTLDPKAEAERRASVAQTDALYVDKGILMPEEVALSRFGERGWQPGYDAVERDLRRTALDDTIAEIEAGEKAPPTAELITPTANETVISVNEARAAKGLPPEEDEEIGNMKVAAYRAMQEAEAAKLGQAAAAEETGLPTDEEIALQQAEAAANGQPVPGQGPPGAVPGGPPGAAPDKPPEPGVSPATKPGKPEPGKKPPEFRVRDDSFEEDKHARDKGGQFTSGADENDGPQEKPKEGTGKGGEDRDADGDGKTNEAEDDEAEDDEPSEDEPGDFGHPDLQHLSPSEQYDFAQARSAARRAGLEVPGPEASLEELGEAIEELRKGERSEHTARMLRALSTIQNRRIKQEFQKSGVEIKGPPSSLIGNEVLGETVTAERVKGLLGLPEIDGAKVSYSVESGFDENFDGLYSVVRVSASVENSRGTEVGRIERTFRRDENGDLIVSHDYFKLTKSVKGQGIGKRVLANQVRQYQELGVKKIETEALWDGQYVWPRMGFDAADRGELAEVKSEFQKHLVRKGLSEKDAAALVKKTKSLHDISRATISAKGLDAEASKVGKQFLIKRGNKKDQGTLSLTLSLDPKSKGFQAFQKYTSNDQPEKASAHKPAKPRASKPVKPRAPKPRAERRART
jgi:phage-related protein (TIGR01555 family)